MVLFAQETSEQKTKFDQFTSKSGVITRFEDFNLAKLDIGYGETLLALDCKVRIVYVGQLKGYYLHISNSTNKCLIESTDLNEILKALDALISASVNNINPNADYYESRFVTDDFEIGFYKDKETAWYIKLSKYGKGNVVPIKNIQNVRQTFVSAIDKIDSLKL